MGVVNQVIAFVKRDGTEISVHRNIAILDVPHMEFVRMELAFAQMDGMGFIVLWKVVRIIVIIMGNARQIIIWIGSVFVIVIGMEKDATFRWKENVQIKRIMTEVRSTAELARN